MNKGKPIMDLMGEIMKVTGEAKGFEALKPLAENLEKALNKLGEVAMHMGKNAMSEKVMHTFAHAYPFMEVSGDVVMAWMLLWRAVISAKALQNAKTKDAAFYNGLIKSAQYFANTVLPTTRGKMNSILALDTAFMDIEEASFNS
jgi:hypothetical protein